MHLKFQLFRSKLWCSPGGLPTYMDEVAAKQQLRQRKVEQLQNHNKPEYESRKLVLYTI